MPSLKQRDRANWTEVERGTVCSARWRIPLKILLYYLNIYTGGGQEGEGGGAAQGV